MTRILQNGEAIQQTVGVKLTTFIPIRIKRQGGRKVVLPAPAVGATMPDHDAPILAALAKAFHWQRLLDDGIVSSGSEIARREGLHPTSVNELLRLTLLSPAIVQSMLAGQQPKTLSLQWLKNNELPMAWEAQHALFDGFDE
ncbi:MAG: hypothetical protein ACYCY8_12960 [Burkholderiales bacterium]